MTYISALGTNGRSGTTATTTATSVQQQVVNVLALQQLLEQARPVGSDFDASSLGQGADLVGGNANTLVVEDESSISAGKFFLAKSGSSSSSH